MKCYIMLCTIFFIIGGISLSQDLQTALTIAGYSVNVSTDEVSGEVFFQKQSSSVSIEFQESSQLYIEAFGWYTPIDTGQWVIGGAATGLPMSATLPEISGQFGVKLHPNYTGTGFIHGIWYSETWRNSDSRKHARIFPTKIGAEVVPYSYLICWEDLEGGGDNDFQDMIVRINGVSVEPAQVSPSLPVQWSESEGGNGHWYSVIPTGMLWDQAVQEAESFSVDGKQGYLATITSQTENDFIMNNVLVGINNSSVLDQYWLGGQLTENGWVWLTGEPFQFTNWDGGEPSGDGPILGIWGLTITGANHTGEERQPGHWNDLPSSAYTFYAIVECGTSIGGSIIAGNTPLFGIPVNLSDADGMLLGSLLTDSYGRFLFNNIESGQYFVSIAPPLGFTSIPDTKELIFTGGNGVVNFELTQLQITPQQRPRGYWAHQAYKVFIGSPIDYNASDFGEFTGLVKEHFNDNLLNPVDFYNVPQPANQQDSLNLLRGLLLMESTGGPEHFQARYAKSELMTMMLNVVSGKIGQMQVISADGRTVSQAITYCDYLVNGAPNDYQTIFESVSDSLWKYRRAIAVASQVNSGILVSSGKIPENIMEIAYKLNHETIIPSEFILAQNYPNPFNPTTTIEFTLPHASHVRLEVYNTLGQHINTLVNSEVPSGQHKVQWDGKDDSGKSVASGVYLYCIKYMEGTETRKMLMVK
ncbi:MAG: T9SS type A sorting domain-containing protein [bacterium]|jgi:hypothetical protein